jgi:hypothetical protein
MNIYLKYILFIIGILGTIKGIYENELASAIIAASAFVSFALIEIRDLKTLNDDKD